MAVTVALGATARVDALRDVKKVRFAKSATQVRKAEIAAEPASDGLLYAKPEGEYSVYKRAGTSLIWDWGELYYADQDGMYAEMVKGADGVVWLRNVLRWVNNDAWIQGTLSADGTKIPVALGTPIAHDTWNNAYLYLYPAKIDLEGAGDDALAAVLIDTDVTEITYTIDGDKISLDGGVDQESGIAAFYGEDYDNEWAGYMDMVTEYTKLDVAIAEPSTTAEKIEAEIVYTNADVTELDITDKLGRLGEVCLEGNEVLVRGLAGDNDIWVRGTINGDKVTFANAQVVGVKAGYMMYLTPATHETDDSEGFVMTTFTPTKADLTFDYDAESCSLTNPSADILLSIEPESTMHLYSYIAPTIKKFDDVARTPMKPVFTNVSFNDWDTPTYYGIALRTATFDAEDNFLDPAKMALRFTVNGEPYTFTAAEYPCLSEDLTELPLTLSTPDYYFYRSDNYNSVTINGEEDSIKTLTVQLVYYGGGTESVSEVETWVAESGIEDIVSDKDIDAPIYNLQGMRVSRDSLTPGIYITGGKKFVVTK